MQMMTNDAYPGVHVGYALPGPVLRACVSTISHILVEPHAGTIADIIYPEWGNVRFSVGGRMALRTGPGALEDCTPAGGIGPTSHATRFTLAPGSYWSVSLTPLGWARYIGRPARSLAETWCPVDGDGPFASFTSLLPILDGGDPGQVVAGIEDYCMTLSATRTGDEERIIAMHAVLVDPAIESAADLADRCGMSLRTLERLAPDIFGFTPKLLIRRQRFLRSLALFMLDPSLSWIDTLDTHYHDQAHFIRDFRRFMDMTPGQYARMAHPVMWSAARARVQTAGTAMQVLQAPPRDS